MEIGSSKIRAELNTTHTEDGSPSSCCIMGYYGGIYGDTLKTVLIKQNKSAPLPKYRHLNIPINTQLYLLK